MPPANVTATAAAPGLAGVALGDSVNAVARKRGLPQRMQFTHGSGTPEWVYPGVVVRFASLDPALQTVKAISLTDGTAAADFGIRVGSSVTDLRRAYGSALTVLEGRGYRHELSSSVGLDFVTVGEGIVRIVLEDRSCISCGASRTGPQGQKKG